MNTDSKNTETKQCTIPIVGSSVSFYISGLKKDGTDTGEVVSVIENDSDKDNPIIEIKPKNMKYDKIWRTVRELL
jgi:hypothetical protein